MRSKFLMVIVAATTSIFSLSVLAKEAASEEPQDLSSKIAKDISGSLAVTTNYLWRGISQTNNDPAIQGDLTYNIAGSDFYVTIFGSNVKFGEEESRAHVEFDYTLGVAHDFNDDWGFDLHGVQYTYPGANDNNYVEGEASLRYKIITVGLDGTNNVYNTQTTSWYPFVKADYDVSKVLHHPIFKDVYVGGHFGYSKRDADVDGGSYYDYCLHIVKKFAGLDFELGWTNTHGRNVGDDLSGSKIYFTVTKKFGE